MLHNLNRSKSVSYFFPLKAALSVLTKASFSTSWSELTLTRLAALSWAALVKWLNLCQGFSFQIWWVTHTQMQPNQQIYTLEAVRLPHALTLSFPSFPVCHVVLSRGWWKWFYWWNEEQTFMCFIFCEPLCHMPFLGPVYTSLLVNVWLFDNKCVCVLAWGFHSCLSVHEKFPHHFLSAHTLLSFPQAADIWTRSHTHMKKGNTCLISHEVIVSFHRWLVV